MVGVADRRGTNAEGLLGIFYVLDYGATGDGQHDDAGGIQAAINAAGSVGGGLVAIPPGVYRLNRALAWGAATNVTVWQHSGVSFTGPGGGLPAPAGSNTVRSEPSGATVGGVPVTQAFGDVAAAGATGVASDSGHRHGMPGDQSVGSRQVNLTKTTADVPTNETTTSTSYVDLTTFGPAVTLTPGVPQAHLLIVAAQMSNTNTNTATLTSISINGAAAADVDAARMDAAAAGMGGVSSRPVLAAAQPSGATHTAKYRCSAGTGTFVNRRLVGAAI